MDFRCERCGYNATTKGSLKRHLTCKTICQAKESSITREELVKQLERTRKGEIVTCSWCEKSVSKANFARHKVVCSHRPEGAPQASTSSPSLDIQNTHMNYDILKTTMKEILQDLLKNNQGTINNTVIINNNSTTTNNINTVNNININNFGDENMSYLTHEFLSYCLMNPKQGMTKLIKNIHYNQEYPENHNVRCKSLKQNVFEKYIDSEWRVCDASNTLDELIKKGYRILNAHYAEHFLTDPTIFDNEMRQRALEKFRFLGDTKSTDYFAVKRDLRLLVKDRTMYLLESPSSSNSV